MSPNQTYGYAGPVCNCPKNPAHIYQRPASKEQSPPIPADVEKLRDEMADTYSNPDNLPENLMSQEYYKHYFNDKRAHKKGFDAAAEKLYRPSQERIAELEALADKFIAEYKNIPPLDCNTQDKFAERIFDDRSKRCMVVNEFIDAYKRGVGKV